MKNILYLLLFINLLIPNKSYSQINVTIDTTIKHQTIFGFGGSLKRNTADLYAASLSIITQIEDLCFNQLKINMIRIMCHPSIEPVNDNGNAAILDTSQLVWNYYETTTKDIYAIQRALITSNNRINYITASNNSAPAWQKANNSIVWGDTILPTMYDEYTEYLSAFLRGMKSRYNITINSISPFNEPGVATFYESLTSSRNQVKDIVIKLRQRLTALETLSLLPHVDIISPDCIAVSDTSYVPPNLYFNIGDLSIKNTIYYLDSVNGGIFSDTAATNSIDIVGTHDYFDENNNANWTQLKNVSKNKPIWITETCTPSSSDVSSQNAVVQAKWIHRSFTDANASAFMMHALYEPWVGGKTSGLISWTGSTVIIPKRYYGFKQFVNFVRQGFTRVNVTDNNINLYVSGYLNTTHDTLIIVAINDTNTVLSNVTFFCPVSTLPILQYATSDVPNYSTTQLGNIPAPVGGFFIANMPAMSIKTFIIPLPPSSTGIANNEQVKNGINIFPNPFSTHTTLRTEHLLKNATLTIYNCLGQTVAKIKNINGQTAVLSRANLPSGLYFVRLTEENKIIAVNKLVITD